MRTPRPPELTDDHRRRLRCFARWFVAVMDGGPLYAGAVDDLARRIDRGEMGKAETLAALDSLDELLSEVWDRRPAGDEDD